MAAEHAKSEGEMQRARAGELESVCRNSVANLNHDAIQYELQYDPSTSRPVLIIILFVLTPKLGPVRFTIH